MIRSVGVGECQGCGAGLNIWFDGLRYILRDRSMTWSPVHICEDPEKRERIEVSFKDMLAFECWQCGETDVAPTSWGRIVDFPSDPSDAGWAEAWVGPLTEHVCNSGKQANTLQTPRKHVVLESYRVWADGAR